MFKLALCQIKGSFDKKESMATVTRYVETAAENGAQVISLPEMWNCPYSNDYFREYAEAEDGPTVKFLSDLAAKHDIYLIGGSIPELDGGKVYNTSFSFDRSGQIIGKHRKVCVRWIIRYILRRIPLRGMKTDHTSHTGIPALPVRGAILSLMQMKRKAFYTETSIWIMRILSESSCRC